MSACLTELPIGFGILPPDQQPPMKLRLRADGIEIWRTQFASAGQMVPQHVHAFDHLSMLSAGAARVWADEADLGVVRAPAGIMIKAGVKHRFEILEPGTIVDCIMRDGAAALATPHEFEERG